jgi:chorismate mutase
LLELKIRALRGQTFELNLAKEVRKKASRFTANLQDENACKNRKSWAFICTFITSIIATWNA